MARVNFTMNSNPIYGKLPLERPVQIMAGSTRGFLIHTTHDRGVVLRAKEQGSWVSGEVTDADEHIEGKCIQHTPSLTLIASGLQLVGNLSLGHAWVPAPSTLAFQALEQHVWPLNTSE